MPGVVVQSQSHRLKSLLSAASRRGGKVSIAHARLSSEVPRTGWNGERADSLCQCLPESEEVRGGSARRCLFPTRRKLCGTSMRR
ncbi:hypothetical protein XELAEV_18000520mg [Xenopus laevis]|uniref:Uncharacterized protein n=1 Tax=Xenopus laevis TaxID=8355 RepID=A0A974BNX5_XENLA|nr:hypothetical protein XELAEV_18000520mg [Xenopus laevis]